jgi:hypothetical protein
LNWNGANGWAVSQYLSPTTCPGNNPPVPPPPAGGGGCSFSKTNPPNFQAATTAPLTKADIVTAARGLGVEPAAVKAVTDVEAGGNGFFADGRPKILFENYWFWKLTGGRYGSCKDVSCDHWDRSFYIGGPAEYNRLGAAYALDATAALQSASWGAFQIMGFNYQTVGYPTIEAFIGDMKCGSAGHMRGFLGFVRANGLVQKLKDKDWAGFAYRYNGAGYKANNYDGKMATAYANAVASGYNNFVDDSPEADMTLPFLHYSKTTAMQVVAAAAIVAAVAVAVVVAVVVRRRRASEAALWVPLVETEMAVV